MLFDDCPTDHPRWNKQVELEEKARDGGVARFTAAITKATERGDAGATGAAASVIQKAVAPTAEAITTYIREVDSGRVKAQAAAVHLIRNIDPMMLAYVTARVAFGHSFSKNPLTGTCFVIGQSVYDEVKVAAFEKDNKPLLGAIMRDLNQRTGDISWKRTVITHTMNKRGFEFPKWSRSEMVSVGALLVYRLIEATGIISIEKYQSNNKTLQYLKGSPEITRWISEANNYRASLFPSYLPMVVPPRMWAVDEGGVSGGYWTDSAARRLKLVRSRGPSEAPPQVVLDALNLVQLTPWAINRHIFEVMREVWEKGLDTGVLPSREPTPLPVKPHDIDTNEAVRKTYRREAHLVHKHNRQTLSKRYSLAQALNIAADLVHEPAIYFPHNLDFRGRMYPVPLFLNQQGPDHIKALLQFGESKPIEDDVAAGWLAIHGANCFGVDKVSLEERIGWVEDNEQWIVLCAADPLANRQWMDADDPWQFLAFCFEWAGFKRMGYGYRSALPCMVDGSCNGIQHFSAMLRDPVGGAAVNLVPSGQPSDIYQRVADQVMERLQYEVDHWDGYGPGPVTAQLWLKSGLIDRKVTKRPVMVLPYGGTFKSCRNYVCDAIRDKWAEGAVNPFDKDEEGLALNYLSKHVWAAMSEVVVAAREAMDWLQKTGRLLSKHGVHPNWYTPDGFHAVQRYYDLRMLQIRTYFRGSVIKDRGRRMTVAEREAAKGKVRLMVSEETDKLSTRLNANGVAPNFVHSMDGCALRKTVTLSYNNGVDAFAVVHDSFGTHAADMETLGACIRHAFVEMYEEHDVLDEFYRMALEALPVLDDLTPPPDMGRLDLSAVHKSDFFFA